MSRLGLWPDEEVGFVGPFHACGDEPQIIVLEEKVGNAVVARDDGIIKDISPNVPIEGAVRTFFQDFKVGVGDAGDVFGLGEGLGEIAGDVDAAGGVEIEDRLWFGHLWAPFVCDGMTVAGDCGRIRALWRSYSLYIYMCVESF